MKQLIQRLGSFPYYVFGVILFFLVHGYSENEGLVPFLEMLVFFLITASIALFILLIFKRKMGSLIKAGIVTAQLLFFYLFYGAIQDAFKNSGFLFQCSRYRILLPGMSIATMATYFFIKKSFKDFKKATIFFNTLFIVLILVDLAVIATSFRIEKNADDLSNNVASGQLSLCDSCEKPDIYLIVMDEYWGNNSLREYFNYNNQAFNSFLKSEGFYIAANPSSNYSSTPLSIASTFKMRYIGWLNGRKQVKAEDYGLAAKAISGSIAVNYLKSLGYEIKNFSIFDILNQPSKFNFGILPIKIRLITSKTLFETMEKDMLWFVRVKVAPHFNWLANFFKDKFRKGNSTLINLTIEETKDKNSPKLVYTHLMMPHPPYLFDSLGKENKAILNDNFVQKESDDAYLSYLVYTNHQVSELIKKIKKASNNNSVIMLMSDHGFRNYDVSNRNVSANNNFSGIYLPQKTYGLFYDSISNVNQFRVLFNTLFKQQLPLLKDSVAF